MSRILLDTHALLWFLFDDPRLSQHAAALIEDEQTDKLLSIVSLWELTIKSQLGKLSLGMPLDAFLDEFVQRSSLEIVPIELPHLLAYAALPLLHRDPFDRLLIAQAQALGVPLVTADQAFSPYPIETVWEA